MPKAWRWIVNEQQRDIVGERDIKQRVLALTGLHLLLAVAAGIDLATTPPKLLAVVLFVGCGVLAILGIPLSLSITRFSPKSRTPLRWFCGLSLFVFPFGTAFGSGVLKHLHSTRQPGFFTAEYERLVLNSDSDPHQLSFLTWVILVLLIVFLVSLIWVMQLPEEVRHMRAREKNSTNSYLD